jgi:hypothetical protein
LCPSLTENLNLILLLDYELTLTKYITDITGGLQEVEVCAVEKLISSFLVAAFKVHVPSATSSF